MILGFWEMSDEMVIWKCIMEVEWMENGFGGLVWQENEWKMKDCREKMDVLVTGLEREREKNQWKTCEEEEKNP